MTDERPEGWVRATVGFAGAGTDEDPYRPDVPDGCPWRIQEVTDTGYVLDYLPREASGESVAVDA